MRIDLELPSGTFSNNQSVKGRVVSSDGKGSLIALNGQLIQTTRKFPSGQNIFGTIVDDGTSQGKVSMNVEPESAELSSAATMKPANFLKAAGLPGTIDGNATTAMLKSFGVPLNEATAEALKVLFSTAGSSANITTADLEAALFLLSRNLPGISFQLLKKYFSGALKFDKIFANTDSNTLSQMKSDWNEGTVFKKLSEFISGKTFDTQSLFSSDSIENLLIQELLSRKPGETDEGNLYFQWPIFWDDKELPDTLEGEAFYSGGDRNDMGFSVRVLVNPPNLGKIEVMFNKFKDSLWTHFMPENQNVRQLLEQSFPVLKESLQKPEWNIIKLSTGNIPVRRSFLSPESISGISIKKSALKKKFDLKV
ncbi:MAG: flagellar hook-length control protein FliK [Candidatus Riflebacteria bacterium]|nr:flagellar hook-length control protein FliK [Candidatus Riflebacteria bacterium]